MKTIFSNPFRKTLVLTAASSLLWSPLAQAAEVDQLLPGIDNATFLIWLLVSAIVFIFILFLGVAIAAFNLLNRMQLQEDKASKRFSLNINFWDRFNKAVPLAKEKDVMLAHDYDGIHELDNDLPPWWKWMFYLSIVFAVVYLYYYHVGSSANDPVSIEEYYAEVEQAEAAKKAYLAQMANLIDESNVEPDMSEGALASGEAIFMQNCKVCHGGNGEGGVGPNLTDQYWIHGGSVKDIFKTIKYGVAEKGMLPWQDKLKPQQIQQVSSYIMSLQGTNPPKGKEPQGEKYEPAAEEAPAETEEEVALN